MRLIIRGSVMVDHPDDAEIQSAIQSLIDDGIADDAFLILDHGPFPEQELYYMQAAYGPPIKEGDAGDFLLEYQDGSIDRHYQCDPVSPEEATKAFIEYLHGEDAWKERLHWERIAID